MESLKEIRTRISAIQTIRHTTSAMKMVSAAKLRRAQNTINSFRPYANKMEQMLANLVHNNLCLIEDNQYLKKKEVKKLCIVLFTSNRGLCGSFNSNVCKKTLNTIEKKFPNINKNNILFITIGKMGHSYLKRKNFNIILSFNEIYDKLSYDNSKEISSLIIKMFLDKEIDRVLLIYNHFRNAVLQIPTEEQFLPIILPEFVSDTRSFYNYILEPSRKHIVEMLIPKYLHNKFLKILLDSSTAEHAARMTAMHQATDNATELLRELRLKYNKARQNAITTQLVEIASGAEALKVK